MLLNVHKDHKQKIKCYLTSTKTIFFQMLRNVHKDDFFQMLLHVHRDDKYY